MSRADLRAAVAGDRRPVVLPLIIRHAAKLEQVPVARTFTDPDLAARSLVGAQKLYGIDGVLASGPELVALAARSAAAPGVPVPTLLQQQQRAQRIGALPDPEAVSTSAVVTVAAAVLERLRTLLGERAGVGLCLPTASALSRSLGEPEAGDWADDATGAVLRTLGELEPEVVVRLGEGSSSGLLAGLCDFFGIALLEAGDDPSPGVVTASGEEFVEVGTGVGWVFTTTSEVPADVDPKRLTETVGRIRSDAAAPGSVKRDG